MIFTSFNFLIFFPLLALLFLVTPTKFKWLTLLAASYFFYINIKPVYALLLAAVTTSTYIFTRLIARTSRESVRETFMITNVILILLPLLFFKYFGSINDGMIHLMESLNLRWPLPEIRLLLPVGISFYTFMAIGYTIDVYNEEVEVEKHPGMLALFVSFFPLILSGPIERAKNMLPQFNALRNPDYDKVVKGMKLILWGYFMKLAVADRLGLYVDAVSFNIMQHSGISLLMASFVYPFQVYADLGGYSLIAIGISKVMGIEVIQNFNRPFFATTMAEFWRRWHISLISWLTDYVYTPLSFAFRKYKLRGIISALMITFLISGIWHGATLTYMVWGLMQGAFLSVEALTYKQRMKTEQKFKLSNKTWYLLFGMALTFVLFAASLIVGSATDMQEALLYYKRIFTAPGGLFTGPPSISIPSFLGLSLLLLKDFSDEFMPGRFLFFENRSKVIRILSYSWVVIIILLIGIFDGGEFIYFKF